MFTGRITDDNYFLCDVLVNVTPMEKYGYSQVEATFFYDETKHADVKHVPSFTWWVDIDIVTDKPETALMELRKEKYESQGATETL
jgi:hypothetical protein